MLEFKLGCYNGQKKERPAHQHQQDLRNGNQDGHANLYLLHKLPHQLSQKNSELNLFLNDLNDQNLTTETKGLAF